MQEYLVVYRMPEGYTPGNEYTIAAWPSCIRTA